MFQKQFFRPQFQTQSQQLKQDSSRSNKPLKFSPKVQYAKHQQKNLPNSLKFNQPNFNDKNRLKFYAQSHEQPSQSYQLYYHQIISATNSLSNGESHPSKFSRTEKSKNNVKVLQSIKQEQEKILKLRQKYSNLMKQEGSRASSTLIAKNNELQRGNKLISGQNLSQKDGTTDEKVIKSVSNNGRHMKTENSRDKYLRNCQGGNPCHNVESSNTYTKSINNSFNPRLYQNSQSQTSHQRLMSPSQEYYEGSYQNQSSNQRLQVSTHRLQNLENHRQLSNQLQVTNQRQLPIRQSRDVSTVNTQQQRASSLSLNKFSKQSKRVYYHCDIKKFYKYNDEGYLTNREIALREKAEKTAEEAIDRLIIELEEEESEATKVKKSKSLMNFPKLNRLKEQAEKERKVKLQLQGKYQNQTSKQTDSNAGKTISGSKDKSYVPSELPHSSSLSKKRFNVIYKDQSENILEKNLVNDSYHQKEENQRQSHIQQVTENARSSIIKKTKDKKSKISQMSSQQQNDKFSDYDMVYSNKKISIDQQSPKGISKIGSIASNYMISSKKNLSNRKDQSQLHQSHDGLSKPSLVEDFSGSSISEAKTPSNHSLNNKKPDQKKSSDQKSMKSSQSQNLEMINSNYKKIYLTDQELKVNVSGNSLLKLKSNTDKDKKNLALETKEIKVSRFSDGMASEQNFESSEEDEFVEKQIQSIVKSSGLNKEHLNRMQSKSSKNSVCGSDSMIKLKIKKKDSGQKWVIESEVGISQQVSKGEINMKKKEKIQLGESVPNLKSSNQENEKNGRLSVESNCLKIESSVKLPGNNQKQKALKSRIDEQSELSRSEYYSQSKNEYSQSKNEVSKSNLSHSESQSIKSQGHSEGSLLQQSHKNIQQSIELSRSVRRSRLNMQRQIQKNKIQSRISNRCNRNNSKIDTNRSVQEQQFKALTQKYGHFLKVDNSKQSIGSEQSQNSSRVKSQNPSHQSQNYLKNQSEHRSHESQLREQFQSSEEEEGFNLTERAEELLEIEENLHQKRRSMQNQENMTEQFEQVLAKIEAHISTVREILYIATNAIDIYSEDSPWVFKSCLLSLKKYHLQRLKIVESLRGKKSCFKIAENELAEEDIKQFLKDEEILLLVKDLEYCNKLNQKMIEDFVDYLRVYFGKDFSETQFNLRPFDDRFDLGVLLEEYRTEILGLREKAAPSPVFEEKVKDEDDEVLEEQTQETIKTRIFKLMEVCFLLSELAGKRIKEFTDELDVQDQFDEYFKDYWPYFQRIVKTFA